VPPPEFDGLEYLLTT